MKALKDIIKYYRERNNITKSELSRKIGVSPSYITMLENGEKANPSFEILVKLSRVFNISYTELIEDTDIEKDQFLAEWDIIQDEIKEKEGVNDAEYEDLYSKIQMLISKLDYSLESDEGCNTIDEELITIKDSDEESILTIEKSVLISTGENIFKLIKERYTELEEYAAFKLIKDLEDNNQ